jgi:serine/threonine-protein kinase HipA
MNFIPLVREVKVGINFDDHTLSVGRLAMSERKVFFGYDRAFIDCEIETSPLNLPPPFFFYLLESFKNE